MRAAKNNRIPGKHHIIMILIPFIPAVIVFMCVRLAVRHPAVVEQSYSESIYPVIAKSLSFFSNLVPFSIWDLFWILFTAGLLSGLILAVFKTVRWGWYILRLAQLLALMYAFFYLSWGFNYFRPPLETRAGWKKPVTDEGMFRSILDSVIIQSNKKYVQISGADYSLVDNLVEKSYEKNRNILGIHYPNGFRRPKKMIFSSYFVKSGISGYFGPFFNEIQLNKYVFLPDFPFLLAHEKAHQFGIASEAEANMAAFIVCTTSTDRRLQYSGYMYLLLYFLKDAEQMTDYHEIIGKIDKRVITDIRSREKYYRALQNKTLENMQTAVNDLYLKSNHITKGVKNYNQVVTLVITWYFNSDLIRETHSYDRIGS